MYIICAILLSLSVYCIDVARGFSLYCLNHLTPFRYVSNNNIFLIRGQTIAIDNYVRSGQSWTNIASSYPICTFRSLHWKNHSWNSEIQKCRLISWRIWVKMGKTMPFLPPMTGNGNHTAYKNGDLGDGLWHCFAHIIGIVIVYIVDLPKGWWFSIAMLEIQKCRLIR